MATATPSNTPLLPPDEKFWKRYSPHFELPLAGATSLLLHGAILAVLAVGGLAFLFANDIEASKPVSMEMVQLAGNGGDGLPEGGGIVGAPGLDGPVQKAELLNPEPASPNEAKVDPNTPQLTVPPETEPELPAFAEPSLPDSKDVSKDLDESIKKANERAKSEEKKQEKPAAKTQPATKPGPPATAMRIPGKGTNGQGDRGDGTGRGNKTGPNTGTGLPAGKATKQQIYAARWRFDLSGSGKEHADKLAAIGFTVAFPDPTGGFLVVSNLSNRPAELRRDSLAAYKDAVKWYNQHPSSIQALAQELRLPFVPRHIILLLPKDREELMAAEEAEFARRMNRDLRTVQETWFDFRQRQGQYEPTAIRQQ